MRRLALVAGPLALLLPVCGPAAAHPVNDEPLRVEVSASQDTVTLVWNAADDDWGVLAEAVGLGLGGEVLVFEDGEFQPDGSSAPPTERLAAAPDAVAAYFADHLTVRAGDATCSGRPEPFDAEVATTGLTLVYHCPDPVSAATIDIDTLADVDSRYLIAASSSTGQRELYRDGQRTFTWRLGTAEPHQDDTLRSFAAGGAVVAILGVAALLLISRRARRAGVRRTPPARRG